jgi:hypothetical protein
VSKKPNKFGFILLFLSSNAPKEIKITPKVFFNTPFLFPNKAGLLPNNRSLLTSKYWRIIPTLGTKHSLAGNKMFPPWE